MLRIRLQRVGRTKVALYRVVVVEHARAAKKRAVVEEVGSYNPRTKNKQFAADRIKYWISVGAQPTGTMHNMLLAEKIISGKKMNMLPKKTPPKKEEETTAPVATSAPVEAEAVSTEAPAA